MSNEQFWLSVGFVGQAFFSMRFLIQWIASEKRKESVIPISFWFFSIGGGLTLFTYALHRLDPGLHRRRGRRDLHLFPEPLPDLAQATPTPRAKESISMM